VAKKLTASAKPVSKSRDPHVVRLGLVQHACGSDIAANLDTATKLITDAAKQGADIVATQELFASTYFCQIEDDRRFDLAEPIPGPRSQRLCELARKLRIYLTASLFEKRAPGLYHNTSIMIDPSGTIIGKYRKMHIPDDPRFYEKYYFTPGDQPAAPAPGISSGRTTDMDCAGWQVQQTAKATTGMLICWDQWYPEAARLTALRGAQILFYPTAIGWFHKETPFDRKQQKEAWQIIQRSHAIANGVFVASINRVGVEEDLEFWGASYVIDPGGVIIAQASDTSEQVLIADCDMKRIEEIRRGWPFLRDRRVDAYAGITQRYGR
jgi:N-carbamoylputrescine amidase